MRSSAFILVWLLFLFTPGLVMDMQCSLVGSWAMLCRSALQLIIRKIVGFLFEGIDCILARHIVLKWSLVGAAAIVFNMFRFKDCQDP